MFRASSSKSVIFMRLQVRTDQLYWERSSNWELTSMKGCQRISKNNGVSARWGNTWHRRLSTCPNKHTLSTNSIHITSSDYSEISHSNASHSNAYTMVSSGSPQIMSCMSLVIIGASLSDPYINGVSMFQRMYVCMYYVCIMYVCMVVRTSSVRRHIGPAVRPHMQHFATCAYLKVQLWKNEGFKGDENERE